MQASRRNCLYASFVLPALLLLAVRTHAEKLMIASTPPGATLEIHGAVVGTAPFETTYPNGYSHKTHTVFGTRLEHSMSLHIYKDGYAPQRMALTNGLSIGLQSQDTITADISCSGPNDSISLSSRRLSPAKARLNRARGRGRFELVQRHLHGRTVVRRHRSRAQSPSNQIRR